MFGMFRRASSFNGDISSWNGEFYIDAACCFVLASLAAISVSYRPA
jgi:hypothetical protein